MIRTQVTCLTYFADTHPVDASDLLSRIYWLFHKKNLKPGATEPLGQLRPNYETICLVLSIVDILPVLILLLFY